MVKSGEIYLLKETRLGLCRDGRPCLVLQVHKTTAVICFFSTQLGLMEGNEISLYKTDDGFAESGLDRDSYIVNFRQREIPISILANSKRMGCAAGEFKKKVEEWYGASI